MLCDYYSDSSEIKGTVIVKMTARTKKKKKTRQCNSIAFRFYDFFFLNQASSATKEMRGSAGPKTTDPDLSFIFDYSKDDI